MADLPVGREAGLGLVRGQRRVSRSNQSGKSGESMLHLAAEKTLQYYIVIFTAGFAMLLAVFTPAKVNKAGRGREDLGTGGAYLSVCHDVQ